MDLQSYKLKIAAGLLLVTACVGVYLSPLREWLTVQNIASAIDSIGMVWYAPILFIAAFSIGCVLFLPATVFIVSAGLIWGGWPGSLYAFAGALIGSTMAFYVSRFIGGDILKQLGSDKLRAWPSTPGGVRALVEALKHNGTVHTIW